MSTDDTTSPGDGPDPAEFGLTARHNHAARLIAAGLSWAGVTETLGVSRSTLARMMKTPGMRTLIDAWRAENVAGVLAALVPEALASIRFLADTRDNTAAADTVRVAAAREILQSLSRLGRPAALSELTDEQARELAVSEARRILREDPARALGGA